MAIDSDKRKGIIGTIMFHLMLLIALFFLALRTPLPLPGEEGVEVDLGYSNTGRGEIQPDEMLQQVNRCRCLNLQKRRK